MNNLAKSQKDISKCLAVFNKNWADEIERVQQEIETKDGKVRLLSQKYDEVLSNF